MRARFRIVSLFLLSLAGVFVLSCGDDGGESESPPDQTCACPGNVCEAGTCALEIVVNNSCDRYERVNIFINPTFESDEEPTANIANGETYRHCAPFGAPTDTQEAETFQFYVGSEDKRAISNTQNIDYTCASEDVVRHRIDLCPQ